jgi:hypothetical protein
VIATPLLSLQTWTVLALVGETGSQSAHMLCAALRLSDSIWLIFAADQDTSNTRRWT